MRVLLIDDHALYRDGISLMLKGLPMAVEILEAGSYEYAKILIDKTTDIDLVLLDLDLPGIKFNDALQAIRQRLPDASIVIISGTENYDVVEQTLQLGAKGYIPKSMSAKAMLTALQLVISGETYIPTSILNSRSTETNGKKTVQRGKGIIDEKTNHRLTPRQYEVLIQLAEGRPNKEIGKVLFLSESTVRVHVAAILRCFDVSNRTQAVRHAVQNAWITIPGE